MAQWKKYRLELNTQNKQIEYIVLFLPSYPIDQKNHTSILTFHRKEHMYRLRRITRESKSHTVFGKWCGSKRLCLWF